MSKLLQNNKALKSYALLVLQIAIFSVVIFSFSDPAFAKKTCKSMPEIVAQYSNCWICDIFELIFASVSKASEASFAKLAPGVKGLIWVTTLLWFSLELLKNLSSVTPISAIEFWKKAGTQFFKVFFAIAILDDTSGFLFNYILSPLVMGGIGFGVAVAGGSCEITGTGDFSGAFPAEMQQGFSCIIGTMHDLLSTGYVIGDGLMCYAQTKGSWGPNIPLMPSITNIPMYLKGGTIYFFAFICNLVVPVYLIDATFRFGIVGVLMPIFLFCWLFPLTKQYAMKGLAMALTATFTIMAMSLILTLNKSLILAVFSVGADGKYTGFQYIYDALNGDNVELVEEIFSFSGSRFVLFLATHIIAFKMIGKAGEIGQHFGGISIDSGFAKLAAKPVKFFQRQVDKRLRKVGASLAAGAGKALKGGAKAATRSIIKNRVTNKKGPKLNSKKSSKKIRKPPKTVAGRVARNAGRAVSKGAKNAKQKLGNKITKWAYSPTK